MSDFDEAPVYDITPLPVGVTLTYVEKAKLDAEREYAKSLEAQLAEEQRVRGMLVKVAKGLDVHFYLGDCPDDLYGPDRFDPNCPACQALIAAAKLEEK